MFATRFLNKDVFENYNDYVQNATPIVPDNFNFAYDVIDEIAKESPNKVAIIWTDDNGETKTFTYLDISRYSNMIANFLTDRGIKRGDTVLLFMRRRWEYWMLMMAMHKICAIPIPSTNQLKTKDIKYRIDTANIKTIIAFDDGHIIDEIKSITGPEQGLVIHKTKEDFINLAIEEGCGKQKVAKEGSGKWMGGP